MDTTVPLNNSLSDDSPYSYTLPERVHNIGLMQERQNLLILSCVLFIGGIIMVSFSKDEKEKDDETKCPHCAEYVKTEAIVCKHCGLTLNNDSDFDIEKFRR